MQKVILIGNLGKDPEVKSFENGGKVANFSVADTERAYKTKDGKDIPEHTEWFDCVARGSIANFVESYIKKGHKVYVEGKIKTRSYDKQDGSKAYVKELIVSNLESLTPKGEGSGQPAPAQPQPSQPTPQQPENDGLPF
jgi:single-strand DNA-binding protein